MNSLEKLREIATEATQGDMDWAAWGKTVDPQTVALLLDVVEASSGWGNEVPEEITAALKALDEHLA